MTHSTLQVVDLMVAERTKMTREARQVDGLIYMLRKVADDLESGQAMELDFDIEIEELNHLDEIDLHVKTYHLKQPKRKKRIR